MRPFLSLVLLAACAELPASPEASSAARRGSAVLLEVGTPVPGDRLRLAVRGTPGEDVSVAAALAPGRTCLPVGCVDLRRAVYLAGGTAGPGGWVELTVDVPLTLAVGETLLFQAVDGSGRTSAVRSVRASEPLALSGAWDDDFGGTRDVSSFAWFDFGTFDLFRFDNAAGQALARNGEDTFFPGAFSRFDWAEVGGDTYFCQAAYAASTPSEAEAVAPSDPTDPSTGGCGGAWPGGFSWTRLTPAALDLVGSYTDDWGGGHTITASTWSQDFGLWHITRFSDARRFVIAQNDAANSFVPGLWSRFDWTEAGGSLWYCQTEYGAPTEAAAAYATPADATDPSTGGCGGAWPGGFAWTELTPVP